MKEKLLDLLRSEGLKSGQFAELLGISQGVVSHLLAGRNKPSFDLLQKILSRFPRINPDWLLLDSPQMYRDGSAGFAAPDSGPHGGTPSANLFSSSESALSEVASEPQQPLPPKTPPANLLQQTVPSDPQKRVERIVIFYEDRTFESYTPEN